MQESQVDATIRNMRLGTSSTSNCSKSRHDIIL